MAVGLCLCIFSVLAQADNHNEDKLHLRGMVDLQLQSQHRGSDSWLDGGALGLRYGDDDSLAQLAQAGLDVDYRLTPTLVANVTLLAYAGDESELTLSEAFLHYRPVPTSQWRQEWRAGAFHLPASLENTGPLWTSPYSLTPSTINTWIGEEMRTIGVENRWTLPGKFRQANWDLSLLGALYVYNDTAGTMLAWRGWASHDRIAGLNSDYPIADLPQIREDGLFNKQTPLFEPFVEVDNRPGFYLGSDLAWGAKSGRGRPLNLSYFYYNNQGKSTALKQGQYAWRSRFHQISAHWRLGGNVELLSQYLKGDTLMGGGPIESIEADYWSGYVMLSKRVGPHRTSLRWDRFEVEDTDLTPVDTNDEHGRSVMLNYSFNWGKGWKTSLSYTQWKSERWGRHYIPGHPVAIDTDQWLLSLRRYW